MLTCLAVLLALLTPEAEAGVARRKGRRGGRGKARGQARLGRRLARRGRQDEDAAEEDLNAVDELEVEASGADEGSGEELPNGCDPATNIGGFLVFNGVKVWCGEQGITDFGPYGSYVAEGSGEEAAASDVEGEEVPAPEEEEVEEVEEVRRGRKARGRKGKAGKGRARKNKAGKGKARRGKQAGRKGRAKGGKGGRKGKRNQKQARRG